MGCAFSGEGGDGERKSDKARLTGPDKNKSFGTGLGGGKLPSMPEDAVATRNRATSDEFFKKDGMLGTDGPRLHKSKLSLIRRGSTELSTQERYTPLLECSDELLLKEVRARTLSRDAAPRAAAAPPTRPDARCAARRSCGGRSTSRTRCRRS
jgi:hypothetical protein